MITLLTDAKFDELEQIVDRLNRPTGSEQRMVTDAIREEYMTNFRRQGSAAGRWARLATATVFDRRRLGYGPTPILVREGDLRNTFTQRGDSDHIEQVIMSGSGVTYEVGSSDQRADWLSHGTDRIPARPIEEFDTQQEDRLWAAIEAVVDQMRI